MEHSNQLKRKNAGLIAVIILLVVTIMISSSIGLYAWAKYVTSLSESASVDIAKWNFNLTLRAGERTVTSPTQTLDLATTTYQHIADGKIAPGTSGEFDVIIDTTGTEVSMLYTVTIGITNCPRNITFSRQKGESPATVVSAGGTDSYTRTITFSEYLTKENASGQFIEKIKWNWPYEGTANGSASTYDTWDTADNGKTANLAITVVGTEMMNSPLSMGTLKNGNDVISSGSTINMTVGDTTTLSVTGAESATYSSSDPTKASVNSITGEVTALAAGTSTITITGNVSGETMTVIVNVTAPVVQLSIGDDVDYTTKLNNITLDNWKLFDIQDDKAYIILGEYLPTTAINTNNFTDIYKSGSYSFDSHSDRKPVIDALNTTSNWGELLHGTLNGNTINYTTNQNIYAKGSPTLELFVDSWNKKYTNNMLYIKADPPSSYDGLQEYYIGTQQNPGTTDVDLHLTDGYTKDTLYFPVKTQVDECSGYWFANAANGSEYYIMGALASGHIDKAYHGTSFHSIRPVICLPLSDLQ